MAVDDGTPPDPRAAARAGAVPLPKRFYERAEMVPENGGFALRLDGRSARTPARNVLNVPSRDLADAIAREWSAQGEVIDPASMPVTRLANTAIDGVAARMAETRDSIRAYLQSDLLYYRAGEPEALVARQNEAWNPIIAWAEKRYGGRFILAEGVMFVAQPDTTVDAVSAGIAGIADPFRLTGLHIATTLTGSALIALALAEGFLDPQAAWAAGHVDEDWNISQWGADEEAALRRERRNADFRAAALALARPRD